MPVSTGTPPGRQGPGPYYPSPNPYEPRVPYPPRPPGPPGQRRRASLYGDPPTRRPSRGGWFRRYAPWLALFLVLLLSGVFAYVAYTIRDVPDPGQMPELSRSIVINDRKGRQVEQSNAQGQYYQRLQLADMGNYSQWATLAAEDRDFYNHPAVDFGATVRAAGSDVLGRGNLQGGSTITQQLVKISVLTPQRSVFRKMQEATIAFGLENRYSKPQILEMYLNRVFYGHNAYGVGAATKVYFGQDKNARDLSIGQAAFLAGIINGPSYYDPQQYYERAKQRQLYVLDGMVKTGRISQAESDQAAQENIQAELKFDTSLIKSRAPHFSQFVLAQAARLVPHTDFQQGGYQIDTTLDLDLQEQAQRAVAQGVANAKLKRSGVNNADLMAARPDTGEILAYVGSSDFYNDSIAGQVDEVTSLHQPGSSFKPYVFEAALKQHKITLATTLHDRPTDFGGNYRPLDYDNRFEGDISVRQALLQSRNVPAVETAQMIGMDAVIAQARSQGIQTKLDPYLSTSIGGSDVTMLQNLQGYQVFANQGTLVPLTAITKITNLTTGEVVFQQQPGSQQGITKPITPAESYLITDTLKDYPTYWKLGWKRKMAGKSGTTGGSTTGKNRDAWMMAYSPDIVVGAWAGNTVPNTVNGGVGTSISAFGVDVGSLILAPFINGLPPNMDNWYKQPDGIVKGSGCPGDRTAAGGELFLAGTQGGVSCPTPTAPPPTQAPATPVPTPTPAATPRATPTPRPSGTPTPFRPPSPAPPTLPP
jgi:membrane peptidoglycan carboxypeptidase